MNSLQKSKNEETGPKAAEIPKMAPFSHQVFLNIYSSLIHKYDTLTELRTERYSVFIKLIFNH